MKTRGKYEELFEVGIGKRTWLDSLSKSISEEYGESYIKAVASLIVIEREFKDELVGSSANLSILSSDFWFEAWIGERDVPELWKAKAKSKIMVETFNETTSRFPSQNANVINAMRAYSLFNASQGVLSSSRGFKQSSMEIIEDELIAQHQPILK